MYNINKHEFNQNIYKKEKQSLLVKVLLFITSPTILAILFVFGAVGLYCETYKIYQYIFGGVMLLYLIPIIIYFIGDIIEIEDIITLKVPTGIIKIKERRKKRKERNKKVQIETVQYKKEKKIKREAAVYKVAAVNGMHFQHTNKKKKVKNNFLVDKTKRKTSRSRKVVKKQLPDLIRKDF